MCIRDSSLSLSFSLSFSIFLSPSTHSLSLFCPSLSQLSLSLSFPQLYISYYPYYSYLHIDLHTSNHWCVYILISMFIYSLLLISFCSLWCIHFLFTYLLFSDTQYFILLLFFSLYSLFSKFLPSTLWLPNRKNQMYHAVSTIIAMR